MEKSKEFKPQDLRIILSIILVLLIIGGVAGVYFGLDKVRDYATSVNHKLADADASEAQITELRKLKEQLSQSDSMVSRANLLFSTPENYRSQIYQDVKNYADAAGLSIANSSFEDPNSGTYQATIIIKSPVSYSALLAFLSNIETSLPKLQVTSIALGHPSGGGADSISTGDIKIDIAVRTSSSTIGTGQ